MITEKNQDQRKSSNSKQSQTQTGGPTKTRRTIQGLLAPYLFPLFMNKKPNIPQGETWLYDPKSGIQPYRIESNYQGLAGIDCGHFCAVIIDIDIYSPEYQASPEAQAAAARILAASPFKYLTKRGGWHVWFRQPNGGIGCGTPLPGIDQKGSGGYCACWDLEAFQKLGPFETAAELYNSLPVFDPNILKVKKSFNISLDQTVKKLVPGNRNTKTSRRTYAALKSGSEQRAKEALQAGIDAGLPRKEVEGIARSALKKVKKEGGGDPGPQKILPLLKKKRFLGNKASKKTHGQGKNRKELKPSAINLKNLELNVQSWIDRHKMIPKGAVTVLSGKKGTGKTKAMLSYIFSHGKTRLGYFSDGENGPKRFKRQLIIHGAEKWGEYLDLRHIEDTDTLIKQLDLDIKHYELKVLFLDPLSTRITGKANSEDKAGPLLGGLGDLAEKHDIPIVLARNMNKTDYKDLENKIAGSFVWFTKPQSALFAVKMEQGSKHRDFGKPRVTALVQIASNVSGISPEKPFFVCEIGQVKIKSGTDDEAFYKDTGSKKMSNKKLFEEAKNTAGIKKSRTQEIKEWFSTRKNREALCSLAKEALSLILNLSQGTVANLLTTMPEIEVKYGKEGRRSSNSRYVLKDKTEATSKK